MFRDREDAGKKLAKALEGYRNENPLVLAIPRGGGEIGYHVAEGLAAGLAMIVVRKLPLPRNPEAGFGAIAEDGSTFIHEHMAAAMGPELVDDIVRDQKQEIQRRIERLRGGMPLPDLAGRTVIVVDDGIAMGSTVRAAIKMCRNRKAAKIIIGSPVAGPSTADDLARLVEDVVILETPRMFQAVAQVYENWYDVCDEEVIRILNKRRR